MATKVKKSPEEIELLGNDLKNEKILRKYKDAGNVASQALKTVTNEIKAGALVFDLCKLGDTTITQLLEPLYTDVKLKHTKGIAFPTTVSPKNFICNLTPLDIDPESKMVLEEGDLVRIELGVHIDGYISQVGKTVVVGGGNVSGRKADVIKAANECMKLALKVFKAGNDSADYTKSISKIANDFGVVPIEGMISQQILRNVLEGPNQIHQNPSEDIKKSSGVPSITFQENQVYTISIALTTSEAGKMKPNDDCRTTVFKRNPDANYNLKLKSSRSVLSQITKNFNTMAFQLGNFEDPKLARMGILECIKYGLVTPFSVLVEKDSEAQIATLNATVLLLESGPVLLTPVVLELENTVKSDKKIIDAEVLVFLK